jgi:glycosyltransferase involved in cell wall biosynthesis
VTDRDAASEGWPSLGVVVPVYNEAAGIEAACHAILDAVERYPSRATLIAVDDGSQDQSAAILTRLAEGHDDLDLVRHDTNAGYGQALRSGAQRARTLGLEYVAFIDSDLTNPPSDILKMGELASQGHVYIKASRFVPGGDMRAVPFGRRILSRTANLVASALFGTSVRDVTNGFRAGRTDLICSWSTHERTFAVIVEEFAIALRAGVEPVEFPTSLTARSEAQRRSAFSYNPSLIWAYLRYPLRARLQRLTGGNDV